MALTATETRLQSRVDKRATIHSKAELLLSETDGGNLSETDQEQLKLYRAEMADLDEEIGQLLTDKEAHDRAEEQSRLVHKAMRDGVEISEDGEVYRTFAEYARDVVLTRESTVCSKIATELGDKNILEAARNRLELLRRTPDPTLSANVAGLQPPQFIDQIFQVIDTSRPIVQSATRAPLNRGTLTYPQVTQRPEVDVQASEKTEAGNQGMIIDMETTNATTYLGGGDLSWQAINWSTPDALQLWFNLAAADYALKTEQDAAQVITDAGFVNVISPTFDATADGFDDLLTAIGAGAASVYATSGRLADTVYMAPDAYWYIFGLTSAEFAQFAQVSGNQVGPFNFVRSRGLDMSTVIVGDSSALLVAETPGAPVELRVVEPAIGGVEVGIIGAFEAVAVDDAFCLISTAS